MGKVHYSAYYSLFPLVGCITNSEMDSCLYRSTVLTFRE